MSMEQQTAQIAQTDTLAPVPADVPDTSGMSEEEISNAKEDAAMVEAYRKASNGAVEEEDQTKEDTDKAAVEGSGDDTDKGEEGEAKAEAEAEAGDEAKAKEEGASEIQIPPSMRGLEETWSKIPEELRPALAEHGNKLHKTLSDQGAALGILKPVGEVIESNADQFEGLKGPDGKNVPPADAIAYLLQVNRDINTNTVPTIIDIMDRYGVREQVLATLGGQSGEPSGQAGQTELLLREQIAGLQASIERMQDPAKIDERITAKLQEEQAIREAESMISRLTKDKPLYAQIPEQAMVQFIGVARSNLGDAASNEDVFNMAYDIAINALPDLKGKSQAAARAAVPVDPDRAAAAKRANSVNVKSTTGKPPALSEEDAMREAYRKAQKG